MAAGCRRYGKRRTFSLLLLLFLSCIMDRRLEKCRREQGAFELSFGTIAAMGPNAAMAHYAATPDKFDMLKKRGLFLVDSGGQYLDGTTDITRTIALGRSTRGVRAVIAVFATTTAR